MEAACVRAELRYRDGQSQSFSIRPGGGGLGALRAAISELNLKASQLLSELVDSERERAGSARAGDEDEGGEEESDEEDGEEEDGSNSDLQPQVKRSKTS
ncbi:uncharacterized protein si:dkeyp-55f12.3 isoform X1 [Cyprinodon tularosa]|uniref:uncharacterized protein si:dkeyp-55f12.3 isoform X1 n=1 Tax=Cyprinodon tularosa TaxID=77115 RepID=UPI0018E24AD5|nr:uncharacterized protein si:dkeyp-55f12.3 isoform X1 [Cyprinodon tularosa]